MGNIINISPTVTMPTYIYDCLHAFMVVSFFDTQTKM
jgi:hypothetical protein